MTKYIAFLRAINVGGHTVKMDELRAIFSALGFSNVETFIASGNVIFASSAKDAKSLEQKIAAQLHKALGFEVATFLRTDAELIRIDAHPAFPQTQMDAATAFNVAFLAETPSTAAVKKLMSLTTEIDSFAVNRREVYWLCQKKQSESKFSNAVLEKTLGMQSTLRGMNTIKKIADKVK